MPGVHKNRPRRKGDDDEPTESGVSKLTETINSRMLTLPQGPPRTEEDKQNFFLNLVRLREQRFTIDECAAKMGVSPSSIKNYMQEPLYKETQEMIIAESKQTGHQLIAEVIPQAIGKMVELMHDKKVSPFVQFKAAETLLTFAGFSEPRETAQSDSRVEVAKFLKDVDEKKRQNVYNINNVNIVQSEGKEDGSIVESIPALPEGVPPEMAKYWEPVEAGGKLPASFRKNRQPLPSEKSGIITIDSNPNEG
jgi:predicted transcriptional regulator